MTFGAMRMPLLGGTDGNSTVSETAVHQLRSVTQEAVWLMLAYCGRPSAAAFCDPFPYIVPRYARETIAEIRSLGVALATAIIGQSGSMRALGRLLKVGWAG